MEIFEEERQVRTSDVHTAEELDEIDKKYTNLKEEENQKLESLRARKKELEEQLKNNEKTETPIINDEEDTIYQIKDSETLQDDIEQKEEPKPIKVTPEQKNNIENKREQLLGLPGPTIGETLGLPGPTLEDVPRLPKADDIPRLPGPTEKKNTARPIETILHDLTLDKEGNTLDLTPFKRKRMQQASRGIVGISREETKEGKKGKIHITGVGADVIRNNVSHKNGIYNVMGAAASILPVIGSGVITVINKAYALFHPKAKKNFMNY